MNRDMLDGVLRGQTPANKDRWNAKFEAAINRCNEARSITFDETQSAMKAAKTRVEKANSAVSDAMTADKTINERLKVIGQALDAIGKLISAAKT